MRLGIAGKLWLVCLCFGLPIGVMFALMTAAKMDQIEFAAKEIQGDALQRPLEDVLQHVSRHRLLWTRRHRGEVGLDAALAREGREIVGAIARVAEIERKVGAELQFTPEGLALRQRSDFTAQRLREKWEALPQMQGDANPLQAQAGYGALITHVRTMITHAGDTSNLILDPDLDSYYLMDVTLLALPQMEERVQQISFDLEALAGEGRASASQRLHLGTLAALLEESDWGRTLASTKTAFNEDRNFYGVSPSLEPSLGPRLTACNALATKVVAGLRAMADSEAVDPARLRLLARDLDALADAIYPSHRVALDQEDTLLKTRIAYFRGKLYLGYVLAALSVLVSSLLAFALASDIVRRIQRIAGATNAFSEGDLAARVGRAGSDELGALATSFDAMADRIGGLNSEVQRRADELANVNRSLEHTVDERTRELQQRNNAFQLILGSAHDGMLTVDLQGVMSSERSAAVERWLGVAVPGLTLPDYVGDRDPAFAAAFRLGIAQIADDVLPLELTLAQLPQRLVLEVESGSTRGDDAKARRDSRQHLRVSYEPILEAGKVSRLLVVLSDMTAELAAQVSNARQEETLRIFHACQRDRVGFLGFMLEARDMVDQISASETRSGVELARLIHTLKGNCGLFGVLSISSLCHEIEHHMAENGGALSPQDLARLTEEWSEVLAMVSRFVGEDAATRLEVDEGEYAEILKSIARGTPRRALLATIARWKLEPVEQRFSRLAEQARSVARRVGKDIDVQIEANQLRLCRETWSGVWSALVHAIRNAVDHGIESEEERIRAGKPARGRITFRATQASGRFLLEIADDGRGVDWEVLAAKAKARGLAHQTHHDLLDAFFADGISTRETATALSGRGVGTAALRAACRELAGDVEVESAQGSGTVIRCGFPEAAMGGHWLATAQALCPVDSLPAKARVSSLFWTTNSTG